MTVSRRRWPPFVCLPMFSQAIEMVLFLGSSPGREPPFIPKT